MPRGKEVCRILKDIRKQIAEENGIEFITSECQHKGDCAGTCPKCEAEVRYLENQLARRRAAGRTTRLVGVSLGLAAVAPALLSCDSTLTGDVPQIDGYIEGPQVGDPAIPDNVTLGENLVFDLIPHEVFMQFFLNAGWQEAEVYDVYPGGRLGENILPKIQDYNPRRYVAKSEDVIWQYLADEETPKTLDYCYFWESNALVIGRYGSETTFTIASINENEMVCYGEVFSPVMAPEAFLGKYVFKRVPEETVSEWEAANDNSEQ